MKTGLFTGVQLLQDESGTLTFGMVGAFGATNDAGLVRLTLDVRYMAWELDGESLSIDIPEQWARQLAEHLKTVTGQLEHLRVLLKLGHLAPDVPQNFTEPDALENVPLLKYQAVQHPSDT
jgi:hypothetical protein